jgi:hypothetical protein
MNEIKRLNKITEGFQKIVDKIDNWEIQRKSTKEHLDSIKEYMNIMIYFGRMLRILIQKTGPNDIKARLGEKRIKQDLITLTNTLNWAKRVLKDWEATVKKNRKTYP